MIEVDSLEYTYPGQNNPALKEISFTIDKGEIFGFLGPSGSGKSTTQKLIIGLLSGYKGAITVAGKNLQEWKQDYYKEIGVGFELPNHFSKLTAKENLALFSSFYQGDTLDPMQLLEQLDLANAANEKVSNFSKGMKMRLNFARAILHKPNILFLDEPTAGLDPVNARKMKDIILSLRDEGKTIFLTTHNMHDADELCDRIALIVEGNIKEIDSPRSLKLRHGTKEIIVETLKNNSLHKTRYPMEKLADNPEFLQLLREESIETIHSQEATLEDVFIKTTGRRLQ